MYEERLLILKMVESGKITAQEAVELLEALEEEAPRQAKSDDVWRRIEKQSEELARKIERAAERFSQSVEARLEDSGIPEQLGNIQRWFTKLPFLSGMANETHEFTEEVEGSFAQGLAEIPVSLRTLNGSIVVEGWEGEGYKLVVTQRVRAKDRETALEKVTQVELPQAGSVVDKLEANVQERGDTSISFHLSLPRKGPYRLVLNSTNGRCQVANLLAKMIDVDTLNGSAAIKQTKAEKMHIWTGNGSNNLDFVEAEQIQQRTANGSIQFTGSCRMIACDSTNGSVRVSPLAFGHELSELDIKTVNSSVQCMLPQMPDLQVRLDASTSVGRVRLGLANFAVQSEHKDGGMHKVVGAISGQSGPGKEIAIRARVGCGSILVGHERDNHGIQ